MKNSNRKDAIVAGVSLIIMALAAGYAYGYVQNSLVVVGNPAATLTNLNSATGLFGSGVIGWCIILITDLLVAWSLYRFFAQVDARISLATGVVRAVYSAILAFAIFHLVGVWQMLFVANQDAVALVNLVAGFEKYWWLGLILFGFHLLGLGYLSLKSNAVPKWIGWLLYVAGLSYMAINATKAIAPQASDAIAMAEMILSAPMAVAELALAVWLVWKGGKSKR
ncbi:MULTISPECIES: DUF4386 domain-containing protein [unclassified Imperialibacter]|uniref:DUF4386 domain-containing protein n=1 Tax=unclassified Imperialibacter TaxID=2629706 RepID=UPI0012567D26|nr:MULTISPECIES: DUF4386 domain-containing protein [unclassified Imperialibacter]CAD5249396.1 conserved membrane hypothetical protein [Imperialibacter sp. 89]CAD5264478.1 conserved membrane hypothetical protein [Imperialibacter sp. 75]VVT06846.1 conserved membrane hypothetical protein [Imperialibacter sp. EC-SDR9]